MTLSSSGAQFPRSIMLLCVTPHLRAMHRRLTVEEARAAGIEHFRLEVPRARRRSIHPSGWIGRHVWTVRTIAEWLELADDYHRRKKRAIAHDFVSLGIHHGDYTYLIPVPAVYLEEATRQGKAFRVRYGLDRKESSNAARS